MVDALSGWMAQPRFNWLKNCCLCVCEVVLNSSNPLCETVTVKYFDKNVLITNDTWMIRKSQSNITVCCPNCYHIFCSCHVKTLTLDPTVFELNKVDRTMSEYKVVDTACEVI